MPNGKKLALFNLSEYMSALKSWVISHEHCQILRSSPKLELSNGDIELTLIIKKSILNSNIVHWRLPVERFKHRKLCQILLNLMAISGSGINSSTSVRLSLYIQPSSLNIAASDHLLHWWSKELLATSCNMWSWIYLRESVSKWS